MTSCRHPLPATDAWHYGMLRTQYKSICGRFFYLQITKNVQNASFSDPFHSGIYPLGRPKAGATRYLGRAAQKTCAQRRFCGLQGLCERQRPAQPVFGGLVVGASAIILVEGRANGVLDQCLQCVHGQAHRAILSGGKHQRHQKRHPIGE